MSEQNKTREFDGKIREIASILKSHGHPAGEDLLSLAHDKPQPRNLTLS